MTSQREIAGTVEAAVLFRDDVFDVMKKDHCGFGESGNTRTGRERAAWP